MQSEIRKKMQSGFHAGQTENLGHPFYKGFRGFFMPVSSISLMEYYFRSNIKKLLQYSQKRCHHIFYGFVLYIIAGIPFAYRRWMDSKKDLY